MHESPQVFAVKTDHILTPGAHSLIEHLVQHVVVGFLAEAVCVPVIVHGGQAIFQRRNHIAFPERRDSCLQRFDIDVCLLKGEHGVVLPIEGCGSGDDILKERLGGGVQRKTLLTERGSGFDVVVFQGGGIIRVQSGDFPVESSCGLQVRVNISAAFIDFTHHLKAVGEVHRPGCQ